MLSLNIRFVILFCTNIQFLNGAVFFPSNSAYGIFAALAVPLDLGPHRNVFISYNFEANYNLPANWQLPANFEFDDTRRMKGIATEEESTVESIESTNSTNFRNFSEENEELTTTNSPTNTEVNEENEEKKSRARRSLLSRRTFYSMLKQRLQMYGYDGENCLLRLICETNTSGIKDINGFLGSVLHIIFSPSSSKDEGISDVYYKAESHGLHSKCSKYHKKCPQNILDLISTPVIDIINVLRKK